MPYAYWRHEQVLAMYLSPVFSRSGEVDDLGKEGVGEDGAVSRDSYESTSVKLS